MFSKRLLLGVSRPSASNLRSIPSVTIGPVGTTINDNGPNHLRSIPSVMIGPVGVPPPGAPVMLAEW